MASPEHRLISRIVLHNAMEDVLDYGICEADFDTHQMQSVWRIIYEYYKSNNTRGSVLSPDAFQQQFSHFEFVDAQSMTTKALCHELRMARLNRQLKAAAEHAVVNADADPVAAAGMLRQAAEDVIACGTSKATDIHLSTRIKDIIHDYELRESGAVTPILKWPWDPLANEAGGVFDEDYVLIWGRPKNKKTFVLTYLMAKGLDQGLRILCYTKEMTPDNILLRTLAFLGGLPYNETRLGKLSPADKQTFVDLENHLQDQAVNTRGRNELIVLSGRDANGKDSVSWLRSKIRQHKPDILFVDGLYLLADDSSGKKSSNWERVMRISRDTRQMVLETRVPVIATMQANRSAAGNTGANLDEIGYSDAVGQDITQGFRVISDKRTPTIALVMGGTREYQLHGIRIHGVPCTNFGYHSLLTEKEIERMAKDDEKHDEPDNPDAHTTTPTKRKPRASNMRQQLDKNIERHLSKL